MKYSKRPQDLITNLLDEVLAGGALWPHGWRFIAKREFDSLVDGQSREVDVILSIVCQYLRPKI